MGFFQNLFKKKKTTNTHSQSNSLTAPYEYILKQYFASWTGNSPLFAQSIFVGPGNQVFFGDLLDVDMNVTPSSLQISDDDILFREPDEKDLEDLANHLHTDTFSLLMSLKMNPSQASMIGETLAYERLKTHGVPSGFSDDMLAPYLTKLGITVSDHNLVEFRKLLYAQPSARQAFTNMIAIIKTTPN